MTEYAKKSIIRWGILGSLIIVFIILLIINSTKPVDHTESVWNKETTLGSLNAKNYYIMYTDIACPYCTVFSRNIMNNKDEFMKDYIEGKDILFEVRVTDFLYEYSEHHPQMSRDSAEAIFCAIDEGRFWDYYYAIIQTLWEDYHSKGIGVSKTAEPITDLPEDYWLQIGKKIGLGESFENCVTNHLSLPKVQENTSRSTKYIQGLPYFKFNDYITGGFDNNWGWDYVKRYLDAGLKK